jgi:hypothetical protein
VDIATSGVGSHGIRLRIISSDGQISADRFAVNLCEVLRGGLVMNQRHMVFIYVMNSDSS